MQLEDYFDVIDPDEMRIKGHRIYLDNIVHYYHEGYSPEHMMQFFPGLSLEKIYAAIAYYLHNRAEVDAAIERMEAYRAEQARIADAHPSPAQQRIRELRREREQDRVG